MDFMEDDASKSIETVPKIQSLNSLMRLLAKVIPSLYLNKQKKAAMTCADNGLVRFVLYILYYSSMDSSN